MCGCKPGPILDHIFVASYFFVSAVGYGWGCCNLSRFIFEIVVNILISTKIGICTTDV